MPCPPAQARTFAPAGCAANSNTYGPAPLPLTLVTSALPFTNRSAASTPVTGSLNTTCTPDKLEIVAPVAGNMDVTTGGMLSNNVYGQLPRLTALKYLPARSVL